MIDSSHSGSRGFLEGRFSRLETMIFSAYVYARASVVADIGGMHVAVDIACTAVRGCVTQQQRCSSTLHLVHSYL